MAPSSPPPLAATHVRMLIAIKWLIVITVYWVVFFWGGKENAEKGKKFSEFHPRGGGKCSNPVPQCLGNLLNSPGSSVLGKSLGEIY